MSTTSLLRVGAVLGWIVLAGFASLLLVMVTQAAHSLGFTLPQLQSPVAAGHQLGEQVGRSLATRLAGGG